MSDRRDPAWLQSRIIRRCFPAQWSAFARLIRAIEGRRPAVRRRADRLAFAIFYAGWCDGLLARPISRRKNGATPKNGRPQPSRSGRGGAKTGRATRARPRATRQRPKAALAASGGRIARLRRNRPEPARPIMPQRGTLRSSNGAK